MQIMMVENMIHWKLVLVYRSAPEPYKMSLARVTYARKSFQSVKFHVKHHGDLAQPEEVRICTQTKQNKQTHTDLLFHPDTCFQFVLFHF